MKKFFTQLFTAALLMTATAPGLLACNYSNFTLNSITPLAGNEFVFNVTFCAGGGRNGSELGADQSTGAIGFRLMGGAVYSSTSPYPATLTSPCDGAVIYTPDPESMVDWVAYSHPTSWWVRPEVSCGAPGPKCITLELRTVGMPTAIWAGGAESGGVIAFGFGCNDNPDMAIFPGCTLVPNAGADQSIAKTVPLTCTTLTATQTGGTAPFTYLWSNGATTASINVCPNVTTNYSVNITDATGCVRTDVVTVTVYCSLVANAGPDRLVYDGYTPTCATLTATQTAGNAPFTYAWSNGGTTAAITVCPTVPTTTYTVTITDAAGCARTDQAVVNRINVHCGSGGTKVLVCRNGVQKCISQSQVPSHLSSGWILGACGSKMGADAMAEVPVMVIAPNPAQDQVQIYLNTPVGGLGTVTLYNINGSLVNTLYEGNIESDSQNLILADLSTLSPGLYFVRFQQADGSLVTSKLIVQ
jgi:Secretion system C-terminal sorting domain